MYEIKEKSGNIRFTTADRIQAAKYYAAVKQENGYAEIWKDGKRFYKAPFYVNHPMKTAIIISAITSALIYISLRLLIPTS